MGGSRLRSGLILGSWACLFASAGSAAAAPPAAPPASAADARPEAWKRVLTPRKLEFPRDHGPHPDYRIEWWYYTGNLETDEGRRFGYQLTFFRTGIQREPRNPSRWTIRDLYTAHLAISDLREQTFHRFEKSNRSGVGWAGADDSVRVWNGEWELRITEDGHHLSAREGAFGLELVASAGKGPVPHGEQGLSRKGAQPGNASYYYSFPRMPTQGRLVVEGQSFAVRGLSWMDHEFSSSFLEPGQQGWDWFSLQFDDGTELMLYQMRGADGRSDARSSGTYVAADGTPTHLESRDFQLTPLAHWHSKASQADYPIRWRVELPRLDLKLSVRAVYPQQEMDTRDSTGIIYWEGAVDVANEAGSPGKRGRGYLEMTGYSDRPLGGILD